MGCPIQNLTCLRVRLGRCKVNFPGSERFMQGYLPKMGYGEGFHQKMVCPYPGHNLPL